MPVDPHEQIRRSKPSRSRAQKKTPSLQPNHCRAGALMTGQKPAHLERVRRISKQCKGIETPSQTKFLKNDQSFPSDAGYRSHARAAARPGSRPSGPPTDRPRSGPSTHEEAGGLATTAFHPTASLIIWSTSRSPVWRRSRWRGAGPVAGRSSPWPWPLPYLWAWRAIGSRLPDPARPLAPWIDEARQPDARGVLVPRDGLSVATGRSRMTGNPPRGREDPRASLHGTRRHA